jgi:hypothetical protein
VRALCGVPSEYGCGDARHVLSLGEPERSARSQVGWRVYKRLIHAHGLLGHCMESLVPMVRYSCAQLQCTPAGSRSACSCAHAPARLRVLLAAQPRRHVFCFSVRFQMKPSVLRLDLSAPVRPRSTSSAACTAGQRAPKPNLCHFCAALFWREPLRRETGFAPSQAEVCRVVGL